jgi:hypothetical protein
MTSGLCCKPPVPQLIGLARRSLKPGQTLYREGDILSEMYQGGLGLGQAFQDHGQWA